MTTTPARSRRGILALFTADGISLLGTRMSALAIPWFVLVTTGSAAKTGVVAFAEMLPYVAVTAVAGPVVDRVGARRVAITSNLSSTILVGLIPLLYALGAMHFGTLVALVTVIGAVRGAGSATYVLVPGVADLAGTPIERATGVHDTVNRVAGMLGAPLAGVLLAVAPAAWVILADAVSFLLAGLLIAAFVPAAANPVQPERDPEAAGAGALSSYLTELREGLSFLRGDRTLMAIGLMVLVTNLLDQGFSAVLTPVWVHDTLDSPLGLGVISMVFGIGAVSGSLVYSWLGPRLPRRQVYAWGFIAAGAPRFIALAMATTLPPVLVVMLVAGFGVGGINPVLAAAEYERTPRELQARVLGALGALAWLGIPFGGLVAGLMVEAWGLTAALLTFGGGYALATLAPFALPSWRGLDRPVGAVRPEPVGAR